MASVISTILNGKKHTVALTTVRTSNPCKFNAPLHHFVALMSSWLCAKLNIVISASENYPHLGCLFYS